MAALFGQEIGGAQALDVMVTGLKNNSLTGLSRFMRNARLTLHAVHELGDIGVALTYKDEPICS